MTESFMATQLAPALRDLVRTTRLATLLVAADWLELDDDDVAGLYMQVIHGGDVDGPEGWPAAYGFARSINSSRSGSGASTPEVLTAKDGHDDSVAAEPSRTCAPDPPLSDLLADPWVRSDVVKTRNNFARLVNVYDKMLGEESALREWSEAEHAAGCQTDHCPGYQYHQIVRRSRQ